MTTIRCSVCDEPAHHLWRCDEHYRCDDCGGSDNLCTYTRDEVTCPECHERRVRTEIAAFDGYTNWMLEVVCPWCGHRHSDSWEIQDGLYDCRRCECTMVIERFIETTYNTKKITAVTA
jgi:hypothetical protein